MLWLPAAEVTPEIAPEVAVPTATMPGTAEIAPLGPATVEGLQPEDALATLVGTLHLPAAPTPTATSLPPLPLPDMEPAELPADPTALFAPPAPPEQLASLAVPQPLPAPSPATQDAALPLPPLPPAPPRQRAAARTPAPQPAPAALPSGFATPAPAAPEPAAIPVLSGAPRFRRPPAPPVYPDRAREAGIEGTALLRLRVTAEGVTQEIRLLRSAGNRALDEAAQAAARRWEIAPGLRNGQPIEAWVEVPVRFRLDE
jgi:protein TonB